MLDYNRCPRPLFLFPSPTDVKRKKSGLGSETKVPRFQVDRTTHITTSHSTYLRHKQSMTIYVVSKFLKRLQITMAIFVERVLKIIICIGDFQGDFI